MAAIRRLAGTDASEISDALLRIAKDTTHSSTVRAEALLALSRTSGLDPAAILPLLDDDQRDVRIETVRTLRLFRGIRAVQDALGEKLDAVRDLTSESELCEELLFCLAAEMQPVRPSTIDEWKSSLSEGGDMEAGRRVFYSAHTTCSNCHTIGGLGGTLGPDLSNVAQSLDRQQIIHSILRPSDQFPPQYQAWAVFTRDGRAFTGLQLDHKSGGDIELFTTDGQTVHFDADQIEGYEASRRSVMPSDLETTMTVSEFRNLVAFLESLR
jgi:putative heme-binding domain-containing protein